jgi:hypothetical protein
VGAAAGQRRMRLETSVATMTTRTRRRQTLTASQSRMRWPFKVRGPHVRTDGPNCANSRHEMLLRPSGCWG